jgi:ParB family chromosome partitioning protein
MTRKRGLGRGLDALIPAGEALPPEAGGVMQIPIEEIRPNPRQPRAALDPDSLRALAESIREHGVLQPLIVTALGSGQGYQLIAGERRLQAARLVQLEHVPAIVRHASEQQRLELALVENLQRTDLNPLEAAEGYRQLADDFGLSHEAIAEKVGKSRAAISNTLRLLRLASAVRQALAEDKISEGHARALLALPAAQAQAAALQTVLQRGLNVRQTEELVHRLTGERRAAPAAQRRAPEETALEEELRQSLGTRVRLRRGRRGGSLVIHFYSDEELNALVERLLRLVREA